MDIIGDMQIFYDTSTSNQTGGEFNHDAFEDKDGELEVDEQDELPCFNMHGDQEMLKELQDNGQ